MQPAQPLGANPPPPAHLSTMTYLWDQYAAHPPRLAFRGRSRAEWRTWRNALGKQLAECLGGFPKERCALAPRVTERVEHRGYRQEKAYFYSEPGVAVPCYVLTPTNVPPPYRPIIALHGHGSDGARLLLGDVRSRQDRTQVREFNYDYARQLVEHGLMVFVPVLRGLGERLESDPSFCTGAGAWQKSCEMVARASLLLGKTLPGLRVWDVMRTVDYVRTRPEPLVDRVACLGLSGGGVVTLYAAALDERIRLTVVDGAFCTYRSSILSIVHCPDNYVPGLAQYAEAADIGGLVAPRPLLIESGLQDPIFPIRGVRQAYRDLQAIYARLGCPRALDHDFFPGGHRFSGRKTFKWLDREFARPDAAAPRWA